MLKKYVPNTHFCVTWFINSENTKSTWFYFGYILVLSLLLILFSWCNIFIVFGFLDQFEFRLRFRWTSSQWGWLRPQSRSANVKIQQSKYNQSLIIWWMLECISCALLDFYHCWLPKPLLKWFELTMVSSQEEVEWLFRFLLWQH